MESEGLHLARRASTNRVSIARLRAARAVAEDTDRHLRRVGASLRARGYVGGRGLRSEAEMVSSSSVASVDSPLGEPPVTIVRPTSGWLPPRFDELWRERQL